MEFWVLTFFMKAPGTFNIKRISLHIIQNGNALDCFHLLRSDPISRELKYFRDAPKILVRANLQTVEPSRKSLLLSPEEFPVIKGFCPQGINGIYGSIGRLLSISGSVCNLCEMVMISPRGLVYLSYTFFLAKVFRFFMSIGCRIRMQQFLIVIKRTHIDFMGI